VRCEKAFRNGTFKTKQYPIKIKIKIRGKREGKQERQLLCSTHANPSQKWGAMNVDDQLKQEENDLSFAWREAIVTL